MFLKSHRELRLEKLPNDRLWVYLRILEVVDMVGG
jgi:hypothetical protein